MCDLAVDIIDNLKINEYKILKKMGSGSSGSVYIASRLNDVEKYILKFIRLKNIDKKKNGGVKLEDMHSEIDILRKISNNKCVFNLLCYYEHFFICEDNIVKCVIVSKAFNDAITLKTFITKHLDSRNEDLYEKKEVMMDNINDVKKELARITNKESLIKLKKQLKRNEYILEKINEELEESIITTLDHDVLLKIMLNILQAMMELYKLGIAHCDIKPDNILINETTFDIQIIDFGQACITKCVPKGTIMYSSPETLLNHLNFENTFNLKQLFKSDVFSVGLVFYELANGKLPFTLKEYGYQSVKQLYTYYNDETILSTYNEDKYVIDEKINLFIESMLVVNRHVRPSIKSLIRDLKIIISKYDVSKYDLISPVSSTESELNTQSILPSTPPSTPQGV